LFICSFVCLDGLDVHVHIWLQRTFNYVISSWTFLVE
jgi:hypothetical protein